MTSNDESNADEIARQHLLRQCLFQSIKFLLETPLVSEEEKLTRIRKALQLVNESQERSAN